MGVAGSKEVWVVLPDRKVRSYPEPILAEELLDEFPGKLVSLPVEGGGADGEEKGWRMRRLGAHDLLDAGKTYFVHAEGEANMDDVMVELMAEKLWTKQRTRKKTKPPSRKSGGLEREASHVQDYLRQMPPIEVESASSSSGDESEQRAAAPALDGSRQLPKQPSFKEVDLSSHLKSLDLDPAEFDFPEDLDADGQHVDHLSHVSARSHFSETLLSHILGSGTNSEERKVGKEAQVSENGPMKLGRLQALKIDAQPPSQDSMLMNGLLSPSAAKLNSMNKPTLDGFRKSTTVCGRSYGNTGARPFLPKSKSDDKSEKAMPADMAFLEEDEDEEEEAPPPDPEYHRSATDAAFTRRSQTLNSRTRPGAKSGAPGGRPQSGASDRSHKRWPQKQRKAKSCVDDEFDEILDNFLTQTKSRSKKTLGRSNREDSDDQEGEVEEDDRKALNFSKKVSLPPRSRSSVGKPQKSLPPLPRRISERGSQSMREPRVAFDDYSVKPPKKPDSDSDESSDEQGGEADIFVVESRGQEIGEDDEEPEFSFDKQTNVRVQSPVPRSHVRRVEG